MDERASIATRQHGIMDEFQRKLGYWLQIAPVLLHSIDTNGKIVAVTDYWLARLGYRRDEIIGRNALELLTAESRQYAEEVVLPRLFRLGYVEDIEYQIVCKNGQILDVVLSSVLDESNLDGRRETISVLTDITDRKRIERKLAESEILYRELIEHQSELVSMARPNGDLMFVNDAYAHQYRFTPHEMVGRNLFEFVPEDAREGLRAHFDQVCRSKEPIRSENQVVMPDGSRRWISWTNRALLNDDGGVMAIHSVGRDIEDRRSAEQHLKESEERYRLLADTSTDMVFRLDRNLVRQYVSPACRDLLGYEPEDLVGENPLGLAHPDDAPHLIGLLRALLDGTAERQSITYRIKHRDGRWIWVEGNARIFRDPLTGKTEGLIGALRDVSARKAAEDQLAILNRQLEEMALVDELSGLANRRAFNTALDRELELAARRDHILILIMIDIDHFKSFNDRYGHVEGDRCLRSVAGAIRASVRRDGDLAARYGGEEFAVILAGRNEPEAVRIAQRIQENIRKLQIPHVDSQVGYVTVSMGVAVSRPNVDVMNVDKLIRAADKALYEAKAMGRNTLVTASGSNT